MGMSEAIDYNLDEILAHVVRESARTKIRVLVRRVLRKHGYPPDLQEEATKTVLEQAEALCADWATAPL